MQIVQNLASGNLFKQVPFDMIPLVFERIHALWYKTLFRIHFVSTISQFPKKPWFLLVKNDIL